MKKTMLFLFLLLIIPEVIFANGDTSFIDVKIGKTYEIFEKLDISSDTNLALYQKNDLDNEIIVFNDHKIYAAKTFGVDNKIDLYSSENQYITSIPSDGSVLIGPEIGRESIIKVALKDYRGYIAFIQGIE